MYNKFSLLYRVYFPELQKFRYLFTLINYENKCLKTAEGICHKLQFKYKICENFKLAYSMISEVLTVALRVWSSGIR